MSETYDLAEMWLREATGAHTAREIEPGIYEHTFTPHVAQSTPFSFDTLNRVIDDIDANAREYSLSWLTSAETMRQIRHLYRLGQMYRVHPIPRRKIRKCHMRKVHEHWRKGRAHIQRVEQAEQAREEAAMQRLRGNS